MSVCHGPFALGIYIAVFFFFFNHPCYCVDKVSVMSASRYITSESHYITPASRYHRHYQSRSSMYMGDLNLQNFGELDEAVSIEQ